MKRFVCVFDFLAAPCVFMKCAFCYKYLSINVEAPLFGRTDYYDLFITSWFRRLYAPCFDSDNVVPHWAAWRRHLAHRCVLRVCGACADPGASSRKRVRMLRTLSHRPGEEERRRACNRVYVGESAATCSSSVAKTVLTALASH